MRPDAPISKPEDDRLDRAEFCKNLVESILHLPKGSTFVYSIEGEWGSGKSSVLSLIKHYIASHDGEPKTPVLELPLWSFSGSGELLQQFLTQICVQLQGSKTRSIKKAAKLIAQYGDVITGAAELLPYGGQIAKSAVAAVKMATHDKDIHELRKKLEAVLGKLDTPIVIFIDDIDRLQPVEVCQAFQAIKAVADLPNFVYVVAFDRKAVASSLKHAGIEDADAYLEKIIQYPCYLPLPDRSDLDTILREGLASIDGPNPDDDHQDRWPDLYRDGIAPFLQTPRNVFRLLNGLTASFPPVRGEVDPVDFIGFQCLRLFAHTVYEYIRRNRHQFDTESEHATQAQPASRNPAPGNAIVESIPDSRLREPAKQILISIFPGTVLLFDPDGHSADGMGGPHLFEPKRICHRERFELYDRLAIPANKISATGVRAIFTAATKGDFHKLLRETVGTSDRKCFSRLLHFLNYSHNLLKDGDEISPPEVLTWTLTCLNSLPRPSSWDELIAWSQATADFVKRFSRMIEGGPSEALKAAIENEDCCLSATARYLADRSSQAAKVSIQAIADPARAEVESLIGPFIAAATRRIDSGTLENEVLLGTVLDVMMTTDNGRQQVRQFAHAAFNTDDGFIKLCYAACEVRNPPRLLMRLLVNWTVRQESELTARHRQVATSPHRIDSPLLRDALTCEIQPIE